mmetsp:Transcript_86213/g.279071  ORF Transcript_86213/g.279071 Transcript_86213/m.279071 type:complete len:389 (+) Transcript_86213:127-1293(+)
MSTCFQVVAQRCERRQGLVGSSLSRPQLAVPCRALLARSAGALQDPDAHAFLVEHDVAVQQEGHAQDHCAIAEVLRREDERAALRRVLLGDLNVLLGHHFVHVAVGQHQAQARERGNGSRRAVLWHELRPQLAEGRGRQRDARAAAVEHSAATCAATHPQPGVIQGDVRQRHGPLPMPHVHWQPHPRGRAKCGPSVSGNCAGIPVRCAAAKCTEAPENDAGVALRPHGKDEGSNRQRCLLRQGAEHVEVARRCLPRRPESQNRVKLQVLEDVRLPSCHDETSVAASAAQANAALEAVAREPRARVREADLRGVLADEAPCLVILRVKTPVALAAERRAIDGGHYQVPAARVQQGSEGDAVSEADLPEEQPLAQPQPFARGFAPPKGLL